MKCGDSGVKKNACEHNLRFFRFFLWALIYSSFVVTRSSVLVPMFLHRLVLCFINSSYTKPAVFCFLLCLAYCTFNVCVTTCL